MSYFCRLAYFRVLCLEQGRIALREVSSTSPFHALYLFCSAGQPKKVHSTQLQAECCEAEQRGLGFGSAWRE